MLGFGMMIMFKKYKFRQYKKKRQIIRFAKYFKDICDEKVKRGGDGQTVFLFASLQHTWLNCSVSNHDHYNWTHVWSYAALDLIRRPEDIVKISFRQGRFPSHLWDLWKAFEQFEKSFGNLRTIRKMSN